MFPPPPPLPPSLYGLAGLVSRGEPLPLPQLRPPGSTCVGTRVTSSTWVRVQFGSVPAPGEPLPTQVRVRMAAASLNPVEIMAPTRLPTTSAPAPTPCSASLATTSPAQ